MGPYYTLSHGPGGSDGRRGLDHHGLKRLRVRSRTAHEALMQDDESQHQGRASSHARHLLSHPIEIRNVIATSRLALNGDVYCVIFKQ
jgi:hypothetical protein